MPRGIAAAIVRWVLLIWAASLAIAVVLLVPSVLRVNSVAADVRNAISQSDYAEAARAAGRLQAPANACRVALLMPAPYSLQIVPGVSNWVRAANLVCDIGYEVGAAAKLPAVRRVAVATAGATLTDLQLDRRFVRSAIAAAIDAEPYATRALMNVQELNSLGLPGAIGDRVSAVAANWTPQRIRELNKLLAVAPDLLGFDRPRTYFVALQSRAEMRATGGFVGQFAIVRIGGGRPQVLKVGTNTSLQTPTVPGVRLIPGTEAITFTNNPMWVNSNLSPHGPDVGAIWMYGWKQQTGQQLDGAIGLDVTTAAELVSSAGGSIAKPDGSRLSGVAAIANYAQNGVYFDFASKSESGAPRKQFQEAVLRDLLGQASSSLMSFGSLINVLPKAIAERRLLITFAEAGLQSRIADSPLAQDIRRDASTALITWNNWAGNKFDFYMRAVGTAQCVAGGADLRVQLGSVADPERKYPAYIGQRLDDPGEKRASVRDQFLVLLPPGSNVRWLTLDGRIAAYQVTEMGSRPVVQVIIDTIAGQQRDLRLGIGGAKLRGVQVQGSPAVPLNCG